MGDEPDSDKKEIVNMGNKDQDSHVEKKEGCCCGKEDGCCVDGECCD